MIDLYCKDYDFLTRTEECKKYNISEWGDAISEVLCIIAEEISRETLQAYIITPIKDRVVINARIKEFDMFSEFANNIFELDGLMAETIIFEHDDAYIVTATIAKEIEEEE